MLLAIVLLPILIWGFFMPLSAAIAMAVLVGCLETILLIGWRINRPVLHDDPWERIKAFAHAFDHGVIDQPGMSPTEMARAELAVYMGKQLMLRRYHQFLRNPEAARGLSKMCSVAALFSIFWAALLAWNHYWILAIAMGLNYFPAAALASLLNPMDVLASHARRDARAAIQLGTLQELYDEIHGAKRESTPQDDQGDVGS